ncbi:hypothetical protein DF143_32745 [Burkholderia cenocepacia]|nr:hypothetical protein DF143_32745 [Burkholderia cenocepacia]RQV35065.1 hypothetical protein DF033_32080 [Burkholderia cenocepacia]
MIWHKSLAFQHKLSKQVFNHLRLSYITFAPASQNTRHLALHFRDLCPSILKRPFVAAYASVA